MEGTLWKEIYARNERPQITRPLGRFPWQCPSQGSRKCLWWLSPMSPTENTATGWPSPFAWPGTIQRTSLALKQKTPASDSCLNVTSRDRSLGSILSPPDSLAAARSSGRMFYRSYRGFIEPPNKITRSHPVQGGIRALGSDFKSIPKLALEQGCPVKPSLPQSPYLQSPTCLGWCEGYGYALSAVLFPRWSKWNSPHF